MTAAIAQQQEAALRPLKINALVGYGLGDFGCNLAFTLGTTFLLYYYTDVAGLTAAAVGTMFFVVRLWDAFADLFAGRVVDRTMTRWGKFRPFILFVAVPLLVMSFLTFHVPSGLGDARDAALRLPHLRRPRPAVLAGQHPLRLARLGDDAVRPPARQAHRRPHPRRRRAAACSSATSSRRRSPRCGRRRTPCPRTSTSTRPSGIFTNITLLFVLLGSIAFGLTFLLVPREGRAPLRPA